MLRILFIGDIVGSSGVKYLKTILPQLCVDESIDLLLANAENAAGGLGLTASLAKSLHEAGIRIMTLGNHTWSKWEVASLMQADHTVVRPANGHPDWPGRGFAVTEVKGRKICVINLLGSYGMNAPQSPFIMIKDLIADIRENVPDAHFIVDMHAEATAEKLAMLAYLDGEVTAVLGTHTHVATADEQVTDNGTAYITDVGMTGPRDGIIGMSKRSSLRRFVDALPARYELADGPCMMNAVLIELDDGGQVKKIKRVYREE